MNPDEYQRMRALEDWYWWFVARRAAAIRFLRAAAPREHPGPLRVLDLGCGTGGLLRQLGALPEVEAVGIDIFPAALRLCDAPNLRGLAVASAERLPFPDAGFHAVTALDVLEHLEDDRAAAREVARVLAPGGVLVASVPAYRWLWSGHDEALHHRRRYVAREVRGLLEDAGLRVEKLTYLLTALFPLAAALRLKERATHRSRDFKSALVPLPKWANRCLVRLHEVETAFAQRVSLPYGLSVLAVARRPGERVCE